ncbi:coiled-coil domain-containing protein 57 isoform X1 [Seriola lalandi dorsalis]|uniref:coiled-coil domain-containing protein 57 isoform X1 n=2 Tax=Seriola lalandi dorsalis TaxID=1841481 RepID=UPI000C6F9589|nr:coiled-coil domain-containing protein 57 isoform X1 [Seriola lalandi dorsalis]
MVYPSPTMQSDGDSELSLDAQLASKEREWKELQALRVHQLESSLKKAQEECSSLRKHYQQLKEDFQFNMVILEERDRELERYDVITTRALTVEHNRQEELSQLRTQVAKLEEQRAREAEERQEELRRSRDSAAQHRLQLDQLKCSMAGEIHKQTEEYEKMKWDLQRRIQEVEGEMTRQRQEMTAAFEGELRRREHEFNLKMDEMCAVVLSHELKVKLLSKETEVHRQAQLQATETLRAREEFCQQIQTQLQLKDQEIKDLTDVKDHRIKELVDEVNWMETKLKKKDYDSINKYKNAVQALKECDTHREAQRQAHTEQLQKAEKHIVELQENVEALTAQIRRIQDDQQEAVEQKDETIQRLCTEVETTRTCWNQYMSDVSSEMVVKDTEMIALQERETKLRTELERSREETERYKQQLSAGLKREQALEQMRVQVELEWQRRCEDMKAEHYLANEQLIQDLTQARDQGTAELKEKEEELQDLTVLLRSVKTERDQAMQGLTPKVDSLASEEIRRLQEQNNILRAVVTQMRKDMEGLSHRPPPPQAQPQTSAPQLIQHTGAAAATSITPTADTQMTTGPPPQSTDISSKVSPAGGQFAEKRPESSVVRKQEDRVTHTESALANIMEQSALVQQLQLENLYLKQRQASGQCQNVQGAKSPPVMHTRLKQAASCIAHLSRDKQQLIEMCNRLRAQISTAGLQEPVEPEKDASTEKQGDQHGRLSALEQLQYQLTTQELQYALRQRLCTVSEQLLPEADNQGPAKRGAANPWSQGHKTTDRPESARNKENTPPLSRSQSSVDAGLQPRSGLSRSLLSSEESLRSLKELWEKLDNALSPSVFSEGPGELTRREEAESGGAGVQIMVHGVSAPIHSQSQTEVQQRMNPSKTPSHTTKTSRPGAPGKMSKIRNYNVKD